MKEWFVKSYGGPEVMSLRESGKPEPGPGEVLVKVGAASINTADWYILNGKPVFVRFFAGGMFRPKKETLGSDVAGVVEAVGEGVDRFGKGDKVYGDILMGGHGSLAEYISVKQEYIAKMPENFDFNQSAAIPLACVTALKAARDDAGIKPGDKVLINGASGGVGTYLIQLAKFYGAEVTAVCSSRNLSTAKELGADHLIDYTRDDFAEHPERYDYVLAVNGFRKLRDYKKVLKPGGVYLCLGGTMKQIFQAALLGRFAFMFSGKRVAITSSKPDHNDLEFIKELAEKGNIKPVIDQVFPFDQADQAYRYLGGRHAKGKVIISVMQA